MERKNGHGTTVIVIRGAQASGKTIVSQAIRKTLNIQGTKNAYLSWDHFFHHIELVENPSKDEILRSTEDQLDYAAHIVRNRDIDYVILDGVYVYPEEIELIGCLEKHNCRIFYFRLESDVELNLKRNRERDSADYLGEERIREVHDDPLWSSFQLDEETVIRNEAKEPEKIAEIILEKCEPPNGMSFDFTKDFYWQNSSFLRFKVESLVKIGKLLFHKKALDDWVCLDYFRPELNKRNFEELKRIAANAKIIFNYVDRETYIRLSDFASRNSRLEVLDQWEAPLLNLEGVDSFEEYLLSLSQRTRRTLTKLGRYKERLDLSYRINTSCHWGPKLWSECLDIDRCSWKADKRTDMQSLDREDLQYYLLVTNDSRHYSLNVSYLERKPMSYSFMGIRGGKWYAIKWGTSYEGRKYFLGVDVFIEHLRMLHRTGGRRFDFWGRRSEIYQQLSNDSVERYCLCLWA